MTSEKSSQASYPHCLLKIQKTQNPKIIKSQLAAKLTINWLHSWVSTSLHMRVGRVAQKPKKSTSKFSSLQIWLYKPTMGLTFEEISQASWSCCWKICAPITHPPQNRLMWTRFVCAHTCVYIRICIDKFSAQKTVTGPPWIQLIWTVFLLSHTYVYIHVFVNVYIVSICIYMCMYEYIHCSHMCIHVYSWIYTFVKTLCTNYTPTPIAVDVDKVCLRTYMCIYSYVYGCVQHSKTLTCEYIRIYMDACCTCAHTCVCIRIPIDVCSTHPVRAAYMCMFSNIYGCVLHSCRGPPSNQLMWTVFHLSPTCVYILIYTYIYIVRNPMHQIHAHSPQVFDVENVSLGTYICIYSYI